MFGKQKVATIVAEFLGTGVLTLLILSVQRSTIGVPFFVALAAGLTLALMVFALGKHAVGYFNPAIALALTVARKLQPSTAVVVIAAQMLGAWGAYWLYDYFVKSGLQPVGGHASWRVFTAEMVGAAIFSFGIAAGMLQRGVSAVANASYAGVAYMVGIIAASSAAIGLLNPAVALGVRAWVWGSYVAGPIVGAIVGAFLYNMVFADTAPAAVAAAPVAKKPAAKRKTTARKR